MINELYNCDWEKVYADYWEKYKEKGLILSAKPIKIIPYSRQRVVWEGADLRSCSEWYHKIIYSV
ncbi:hypothetical protein NXH64_04585 [Butyrivibrio fibrisolvens]|uniref:hypothetical protein n=1 Tax=Pseudobutyrivibrio ruminis TaxID=46206 RepID=UPI000485B8C7|nr:hypothetical protein [Pseudobutyrivibrio ruminis]MDC7278777.1 hypothetical protein [Butyrivibrio fibrisolvens]